MRTWKASNSEGALLAKAFEPGLRGTYCSMAGDLPRGRTEMANYNGYLVELAGDFPCPLNRQVFDLVERMARERIRPHLGVLDELAMDAKACLTP